MGHESIPGGLRKPSRTAPAPTTERKWDWFLTDNLKWVIVTLAIPLVGGWITTRLGEQAEQRASEDRKAANIRAAEDRQATDLRTRQDTRQRAYTDIVNRREEAETGVRSTIFSTLLRDYLDPGKADLARRMTVLELLASNFDESLNLSPLFWQIDREVAAQPASSRAVLREQLSSIATAVKMRQVDVLAASGARNDLTVTFEDFRKTPLIQEMRFDDPTAAAASALRGCRFTVALLERDAAKRRFFAVVTADVLEGSDPKSSSCLDRTKQPPEPQQWSFWIDEFDFPLIAYTRLSTAERFAIALVNYDEAQGSAKFSMVFFPSSRGGARDRPFVDTVIQALNDPAIEAVPRTSGPSVKGESK